MTALRPILDPEPASPAPAAPQTQTARRTWRRSTARRYAPLGAIAFALAASLWLFFRPAPRPDFVSAPIDDVLDYTLLTEDFNRLPVDERLDLIRELLARVKSGSADDSALMAEFAARISGALRKQLERNASLLAIDLWDKFARDYRAVPLGKRADYLDTTFLELSRLTEAVAGQPSDKTDSQRLAEAREQARHDMEMFDSGRGPTGMQLARMAQTMRSAMLKNGSPQQTQRAQQLMRDMTAHFRSPPAAP